MLPFQTTINGGFFPILGIYFFFLILKEKTVVMVEEEDGGAHTRFVILNEDRDSR